jgi:hypothetical protein
LKKFVKIESSVASVAAAAAEDDSIGLSLIVDTWPSSSNSLQSIKNQA